MVVGVPAEELQRRVLEEWAPALKMESKVEELTERELAAFERAFERLLVFQFPEREVRDIFVRHKGEILFGCMIAKAQFDADFDGESPDSGKFGMTVTRACYLGVGNDWEDASPFSTGSPQNWIHSGTSLLGGTAGNDIKIGKNQVTVVVGVGSYHPSPKIESFAFWVDGNPKPTVTVGYLWKVSDLHVKELDKAIILYEDRTFLAKVFISAALGTSVEDYPYLLGVSFLPESILRADKQDAATIASATNKVVLVT